VKLIAKHSSTNDENLCNLFGRRRRHLDVCNVLVDCGKELHKHPLHVARSAEAEKAIEESDVSTTSCHHHHHMFTPACLIQRNCCTPDRTLTLSSNTMVFVLPLELQIDFITRATCTQKTKAIYGFHGYFCSIKFHLHVQCNGLKVLLFFMYH